jgi:hypothetical protein
MTYKGGMSRETRKLPADVNFSQSGRVRHDERGNAIWEWAGNDAETSESSTQRIRKLDNPGLALADDAPPPKVNGYSPYDSGVLEKNEPPRKKDLRRLSEWMKLKKSYEKAKSGAG